MKKVGSTIENLLRSHGLWQGYQQYLLIQQWPELAGAALSEVTRAESLQHGILKVAVKDSVWSYHLSLMKPQLIEKLNRFAGNRAIKDIQFKIDDQADWPGRPSQ